ncbi:hypothetical protein TNCV_2661491 [Trichonephila clavipes]|nr:hypothetical protein TNCV_2661491 [Trichonephila clavipes]
MDIADPLDGPLSHITDGCKDYEDVDRGTWYDNTWSDDGSVSWSETESDIDYGCSGEKDESVNLSKKELEECIKFYSIEHTSKDEDLQGDNENGDSECDELAIFNKFNGFVNYPEKITNDDELDEFSYRNNVLVNGFSGHVNEYNRHGNKLVNGHAKGLAKGHANGLVIELVNGHVNGLANGLANRHVNGLANRRANGHSGHMNGYNEHVNHRFGSGYDDGEGDVVDSKDDKCFSKDGDKGHNKDGDNGHNKDGDKGDEKDDNEGDEDDDEENSDEDGDEENSDEDGDEENSDEDGDEENSDEDGDEENSDEDGDEGNSDEDGSIYDDEEVCLDYGKDGGLDYDGYDSTNYNEDYSVDYNEDYYTDDDVDDIKSNSTDANKGDNVYDSKSNSTDAKKGDNVYDSKSNSTDANKGDNVYDSKSNSTDVNKGDNVYASKDDKADDYKMTNKGDNADDSKNDNVGDYKDGTKNNYKNKGKDDYKREDIYGNEGDYKSTGWNCTYCNQMMAAGRLGLHRITKCKKDEKKEDEVSGPEVILSMDELNLDQAPRGINKKFQLERVRLQSFVAVKKNSFGESTVRAIKKNEAAIRKFITPGTKLSTKFASYTRDVLLERTEKVCEVCENPWPLPQISIAE